MAEIGGQQVNLTTAYAPGGVTFNYCEGVNDAGQILVWSLGANGGGTTNRTFLLTPVVVPEPSTLLLSAMGLLGLLAYAWRKRKKLRRNAMVPSRRPLRRRDGLFQNPTRRTRNRF